MIASCATKTTQGVCHHCPHGVCTTDDEGGLVRATWAKNKTYEELPCSNCQLHHNPRTVLTDIDRVNGGMARLTGDEYLELIGRLTTQGHAEMTGWGQQPERHSHHEVAERMLRLSHAVGAITWQMLVERICERITLAEIGQRHGMKKQAVHARFKRAARRGPMAQAMVEIAMAVTVPDLKRKRKPRNQTCFSRKKAGA